MLGEITHLQAIIDDLTVLTTDPHKLPPASEQVNTHTDIFETRHIQLFNDVKKQEKNKSRVAKQTEDPAVIKNKD